MKSYDHLSYSQSKTNFQVFVLKYNNGIHDLTLYWCEPEIRLNVWKLIRYLW